MAAGTELLARLVLLSSISPRGWRGLGPLFG
jgi:hypothetical protein